MDYKLPKDYKKPDFVGTSKMMRDRIGTNMATFEKSLEAVDLIQLDYESPIHLIYSDLNQQVDEHIYKCVLNVGVDVDKKELVKALQYDRNQYDKGYQNAKAKYDRGHGHWEEFDGKTELRLICSKCSYHYTEADPCCAERLNYCPNCGAQMDEEEEE